MRVSEIRVKQIRVNQGLGVYEIANLRSDFRESLGLKPMKVITMEQDNI